MTDAPHQKDDAPTSGLAPLPPGTPARQPAGIRAAGGSAIELFFFAYRDFTRDADVILTEFGFGRAHHRVLHFVARNPGLRVTELLEILNITKQSLGRVLKQLLARKFIEQRSGAVDRRERLLYVTPDGAILARRLMEAQLARVDAALKATGADGHAAIEQFLLTMVDRTERKRVAAITRPGHEPETGHLSQRKDEA
jgi:DNA-binding MarR family transcriptional regulator